MKIKKLIEEVKEVNELNLKFLLENLFNRLNNQKILTVEEKKELISFCINKKYLTVNPNIAKYEKEIVNLKDSIKVVEKNLETNIQKVKKLEEDYVQMTLDRNKTKLELKYKDKLEQIYILNKAVYPEEKIENNSSYFNDNVVLKFVEKVGIINTNRNKDLKTLIDKYPNKDNLLLDLMDYRSYLNTIDLITSSCNDKKKKIEESKENLHKIKEELNLKNKEVEEKILKLEQEKIINFNKVGEIFKTNYKNIFTFDFIENYNSILKKLFLNVENLKKILDNSNNVLGYLNNMDNNQIENEKRLKLLLRKIEDPNFYLQENNMKILVDAANLESISGFDELNIRQEKDKIKMTI